jgi:hypothetical protein
LTNRSPAFTLHSGYVVQRSFTSTGGGPCVHASPPLFYLHGDFEMDDWHIRTQALHSSKLTLDISRHDDGYVLTFKTPNDFYKIYFSPSGQITHAKHYDADRIDYEVTSPLAAAEFKLDRSC